MYILFGIFTVIAVCFVILGVCRRKRIICRVRSMEPCKKVCLINDLLRPFGFEYHPGQDIISSRRDAWQRPFGYRGLFDRTAPRFGMVFDCEPVYFYYGNRTYLVELWKGQYGINLGGELGMYYTEGRIPAQQLGSAQFTSVPDEEMCLLRIAVCHRGQRAFENEEVHWWLTGFCMGVFCEPEDLAMEASVTFREPEMLQAFYHSLLRKGYRECDICVCDHTVTFTLAAPVSFQPRNRRRCAARWSQWKNRRFCRLFLFFTRPFAGTLDRILYLYLYLPSAFRHMFCYKRNRRQRFHTKRKPVRLYEL